MGDAFVWRHALRTELVHGARASRNLRPWSGKNCGACRGVSRFRHSTPFAYDGLLHINGGRGRSCSRFGPGAQQYLARKDSNLERLCGLVATARGHLSAVVPRYEGAVYSLTATGILSRFDAKTGTANLQDRIDPRARHSRPHPGPTTANCSVE